MFSHTYWKGTRLISEMYPVALHLNSEFLILTPGFNSLLPKYLTKKFCVLNHNQLWGNLWLLQTGNIPTNELISHVLSGTVFLNKNEIFPSNGEKGFPGGASG